MFRMNFLSLKLGFKFHFMKSKTTFRNTKLILIAVSLLISAIQVQAQACVGNKVLIYIDNVTATSNALEYDIFVKNIGTTDLKMANFGGNVLYGDNFLPVGATGTLTVVDDPSQTGNFSSLYPISQAQHLPTSKQLRWTQPPMVIRENAVVLPANVALKFARFRFESSIPWDINSETDLTFSTSTTPGIFFNVMSVFCNQNLTSTVIALANNNLVLQDETATTPSVHVNMFRLLANQGFENTSQATAYPNPFDQSFKLTSSATEALNVIVSDMTGRIVEQRQLDASSIDKQDFGFSYPTGFYLVSVSQGSQTQTFKMLKK